MSHNVTTDSGNPFATPLNDWRSEGAPPNINFRELPSCILVLTMHTHCCIPAVHGQCWVQFSQITPVQWTNHEMCQCFSKNQFHHLRCVHMFLICWAERCHLHDGCQPTLELSSPSSYPNVVSPNTNINWQWISRVEMFCLYKLSHHEVFCMTVFPLSLPLHINLSPK